MSHSASWERNVNLNAELEMIDVNCCAVTAVNLVPISYP
jgi:hypothetical protein